MKPNTNPQAGPLKTVSQFLASGAPLAPIPDSAAPYNPPWHAYPQTPPVQATLWNRATAPIMELTTLFSRPKGSTAR